VEAIVFETFYLAMIFFVGLMLSRILVPMSGKIALVLGLVDRPNDRKVHTQPVPQTGGLAMAVALFATILICVEFNNRTVEGFLLGAGIIVLTGLMDDSVGLKPTMKFLGEILAAAVFVKVAGVSLVTFGDLLGFGEIRTGWLAPYVTIFCMVGVMNALNLSDGLDGLAGGISFIAAALLSVAAYEQEAWYWSVLALSLVGVLLGFLRHNDHPASLFMGDTGSLLLGFSLSAIAVGLARPGQGYTPVAPVSLGILLALPIVDTLRVMGYRLARRKNPFKADKTHLHHRLMALAVPHAGVVSIIYVIMLGCAVLAWYGRTWPEWIQFFTVTAFFVALYCGLHCLERRQVDLGRVYTVLRRAVRHRRYRDLTLGWRGDAMKWLAVLPPLLLAVPLVSLLPTSRILGLLSLSAALLLLLLFPWRGSRRRMPLGHGALYVGCVLLLVLYIFAPDRPPWMMPVLYVACGAAFVWALVFVAAAPHGLVHLPGGFEILMLFLSWSFPLVLLPMLGVDDAIVWGAAAACLLALPLLAFGQLALLRRPAHNTVTAAVFIVVFCVIGGTAFL